MAVVGMIFIFETTGSTVVTKLRFVIHKSFETVSF